MKIVLSGLGGMGRCHYAAWKEMPDVEVVAFVGVSESDRVFASEQGKPVFPTITEACKAFPEADTVDITTPTYLHKKNVLEALDSVRRVIVEKPCALSRKDAEEMFGRAEEKGASLVVAQVLRFTKEYSALRSMVRGKTYGEVLDAVFTRLTEAPGWSAGGWLFDTEKSGGVAYDLHIHDLDAIVSVFGVPSGSEVSLKRSEGVDYDEYLSAVYSYPGFNVRAEAGWLKASIPFTATYRVIFSNAVVVYDGKKLTAYPYSKEKVEYDLSYDKVIATGINVPPTGWYYEELCQIKKHFEQGGVSPVPADEVLSVLSMLE